MDDGDCRIRHENMVKIASSALCITVFLSMDNKTCNLYI